MNVADILSLLGGVALFLFGMTLMGEGLKQVAGNKLEVILYRLSGTPLKGILLGTGVTAVIQSSSATSVMVVGFVNSGMMKTLQAISVIMGAVIGTSITGWVISLSELGGGSNGWTSLLSTESISAIVAIIGIYLRMFSKKRSSKPVGDILMGFAVLMFGMKAMSSSVSGLRNSPVFLNMLTQFSNPFLGILIGALFTTVIQSASAAVGILQALSSTGAITFEIAYPIIMGIAIGAAMPVLLSSFGSSTDGRRSALSYLVIDVLGCIIGSVLLYGYNFLFGFPLMGAVLHSVQIALVNTIFRVVVIALLLPAIKGIEAITRLFIKDQPKKVDPELEALQKLDDRFIQYPPLAVESARLAINEMGRLAEKNIKDAIDCLKGYTPEKFAEVKRVEDIIDKYEDSIGTYLVHVTGQAMSTDLSTSVSKYLHTLTDFERISDHALNIAESAREQHEKNVQFTPSGAHEMDVLLSAIETIIGITIYSFTTNDFEDAYRVEPLEEVVDDICEQMKINHVERLTSGECTLLRGYIFNDLLGDLERISDHCSNTAAMMIELNEGIFGLHEYTNEIKDRHTHNFEANYQAFKNEFHI